MKFTIDKSLAELGITSVVLGIARNVDPQAPLSEAFLQKQKKAENWALSCTIRLSKATVICYRKLGAVLKRTRQQYQL